MILKLQEMDPVNVLLLFIILSILLFIFLFFVAYKVFFSNSSRHDYTLLGDDLFGFGDFPREYINDEEALNELAEEFDFTHLSPEEQNSYLRGEEFTKTNPPNFHNTRGQSFTHENDLLIKDCGLNAFEFEQDDDILQSRYTVADKTEIHFNNNDSPYSTATSALNLSLPVKNRTYSDTIYFEMKVFEFDANNKNGHFSIGLVTKPYPSFRLPGYNNFSIAYESTGNLKINKPFPTPLQQHMEENSKYNAQVLPPLQQSDIVGFGYVISSGTIFITRNGKKLMDVIKGCFVDLYPAIGCFLTNAKFQSNIGQLGYVWIEANVRKYGFISTSDYKKIKGERGLASLPEYGNLVEQEGDKLLDKGEELPPDYPEDELDFFGRSTRDLVKVGSSSKSQKLKKLAPQSSSDEKGQLKDDKDTNETKSIEYKSASLVTDEPEEVMDLRERLYEDSVTPKKAQKSETSPLIESNISENDFNYNGVDNENKSNGPFEHTEEQEVSSQQVNEETNESTQDTTNQTTTEDDSTPSPEGAINDSQQGITSPLKSKNKKKKKHSKKSNKKKGKKK